MQPSKSIAVQAATSTEKDAQRITSDDDFEEVKEDIRSSSFDDNCDASNDDQSSVIPFEGMLFTSWKDITNAVHSEALSHNKQVSCTASLSGSKKKFTNVCTFWVVPSATFRKCVIGLARRIPMTITCALNA